MQLRRHAELGRHAGHVALLAVHRVDQRDVLVDQLAQVLVAAGDDHLDALRARPCTPACRSRRRPRCPARSAPASRAAAPPRGSARSGCAGRRASASGWPCIRGYQSSRKVLPGRVEDAGRVVGRAPRSRSACIMLTMPRIAPVAGLPSPGTARRSGRRGRRGRGSSSRRPAAGFSCRSCGPFCRAASALRSRPGSLPAYTVEGRAPTIQRMLPISPLLSRPAACSRGRRLACSRAAGRRTPRAAPPPAPRTPARSRGWPQEPEDRAHPRRGRRCPHRRGALWRPDAEHHRAAQGATCRAYEIVPNNERAATVRVGRDRRQRQRPAGLERSSSSERAVAVFTEVGARRGRRARAAPGPGRAARAARHRGRHREHQLLRRPPDRGDYVLTLFERLSASSCRSTCT